MSVVSDSSQEASNTGISSGVTPVSSPQVCKKSEIQELSTSNCLPNSTNSLKQHASVSEQSQKRRSSSRSIKRKKFDDELVESSLVKTSRVKSQNILFSNLSSLGLSSNVTANGGTLATSYGHGQSDMMPSLITEKKKHQRPQKRIKKAKNNQSHVAKNASRWCPTDDLMLIYSVQSRETNDLKCVYRGVKFSTAFTLREIEERWYSLLYDAAVSKAALYAIKQLSPDIILQMQAKALFSHEEEKLIASVKPAQGSVEVFQRVLDENPTAFYSSRTAKCLFNHWSIMKHYNLLHQEKCEAPSTSDCMDTALGADIDEISIKTEGTVSSEGSSTFVNKIIGIKREDNGKLHVLVELIAGISIPEFDDLTFAVLRGRIVRYLIRSEEVSIGRSTRDSSIDIDLSLDGPAYKVSRRQGTIKLDSNGEFFIYNEGKRPLYVDGKPVLQGNKAKVITNSVIQIAVLRFIFILNQDVTFAPKIKKSES